MNDKFKCDFEKERSNEVELVASNLEAILNLVLINLLTKILNY